MTSGRPTAIVLTLLWPWPGNSGGRIRAAAIVNALKSDHDVTVLAADHTESGFRTWDAAVARTLGRRASRSARVRDIAEGALLGDHTAARRAVNAGLDKAFGEALDDVRPSVVVLGPPYFGPFIAHARRVGAGVVLDPNERLSRVARANARARRMPLPTRLRALLEAWTLNRMERRAYPRADVIWVASERERENFNGIVPLERVKFVPNPISRLGEVSADGAIRAVAFVGWYGHAPNEAAALELITEVMPAIRRAGGPQRLIVIGREPTPAMRASADSQVDTQITGEVPDALAVLAEAGLLVLPIRSGGGTRIKVLEAASIGVPIVSTHVGVEGLELEPGRHFLVAETPQQFADAVLTLVGDAALRSHLVAEARLLVEARYSPEAVLAAVRANLPR